MGKLNVPPRGPALTRRQRRQRWAWALTVATLIVLGTSALVLERQRDTDRASLDGAVTEIFGSTQLPTAAPALDFSDVTAATGLAGIGPRPRSRTLIEDTSGGLAWGDVDGDGWVDLFAAGVGQESRLGRLWRNVEGRFEDVTLEAGVVADDCHGMGATWIDENQDGRLDLFVTCFGPNKLFRNLGRWRFEEVAAALGLADPAWSTGAAWADYDRDGDLDLAIANYVDPSSLEQTPPTTTGDWEGMPFTLNPNAFDAVPNRLYRRGENGRYEDVALGAGVSNPGGRSLSLAWIDLDRDGWLDLVVNNDVSPNAVFRSLGDLGGGEVLFEDVSASMGAADPRGSMGLCISDFGAGRFPPDGLPDLFITHWVAQENALYQLTRTGRGLEVRDRTRDLGLGEISLETVGWGCAAVDLDFDQRLDLVVVNGSTLEQKSNPMELRPEPMFLFWNDGKSFVDLAAWAGKAAAQARHARGLAIADYDRDGDLDLGVAVSNGGPVLLRNEGHAKAGLILTLGGLPAQHLGARVEVAQRDHTQVRWIGGDVSYLSGHAAPLLFGITPGEPTEVHVDWADGSRSTTKVTGGLVRIDAPTSGASESGE